MLGSAGDGSLLPQSDIWAFMFTNIIRIGLEGLKGFHLRGSASKARNVL